MPVRRDERQGLRAYRFETLPDRVDALVSTRIGGVSTGQWSSLNLGLRVGDDADAVLENRRRLFAVSGLALERSVWCKQVHQDAVTVVEEADAGRGALSEDDVVADTDALVTDVPGLTLSVTLADCVPVVIYDPARHVVGLAHAGWGGTVRRIASRTVATMRDRWRTEAGDLVAAIGPSIAQADYEVGGDVISAAEEAFGEDIGRVLRAGGDGKALFDLWEANALDLQQAGVSRARIEVAGMSPAAALDEYYSHRIEGPTGRFITAVTLRD
jgi:YfiH family protein